MWSICARGLLFILACGCGARDLTLKLTLPDGGCPVTPGVQGVEYEISRAPDDGGVRQPLCGVTLPVADASTSDEILAVVQKEAPSCDVPRSTNILIEVVALDSTTLAQAAKRLFCASAMVRTPDGTSSSTKTVALACESDCAQACVVPVCAAGQDCSLPIQACGGLSTCRCPNGTCQRHGNQHYCP